MSANEAEQWKRKGNEFFSSGDWAEAEKMYSQAIIQNSALPGIYTNRALVRLKLERYEDVITDCERALELKPLPPLIQCRYSHSHAKTLMSLWLFTFANVICCNYGNGGLTSIVVKGEYYLGQALTSLSRANEGLKHCLKAYELAVEQHSPSTNSIVLSVLEAKKRRWEGMERRRIDQEAGMLNELKQMLRSDMEKRIAEAREQSDVMSAIEGWNFSDEISLIRDETKSRCDALEQVFARAEPDKYKLREVPDYLIDSISFTIMVDPVMTKTGQSYERATILDHLRRSETDPITREKLRITDLRTNIGLKQACAKFLDENGWAVDY